MLVIIYKNEDGSVSKCIPFEKSVEEVLVSDVPQDRDARIVDDNTLPNDCFDFFDAWEMTPTEVIVSLEKAKEITKGWLRAQREPLLQAQDILFQRALENGEDTSAIVAEKQRLRDITKLADVANSLDELRTIKVEK
jgi:hypothetical protein